MLKLFLCGDVMLGRAIDQLFKYKNDPTLYESFVKSALYYLPPTMKKYSNPNTYVNYDYIWNSLLSNKFYTNSDLRIINLETSITTSKTPQNKQVLYKMHPKNIVTLKIAKIDYCNMANNHVMDWGISGGIETEKTLTKNNINFGGIGYNINEAKSPKIINVNNKKIYIFSFADIDSGTPLDWKATNNKFGVNVIDTSNGQTKINVGEYIKKYNELADFIIISIHWGPNWSFDIPSYHKNFAHYLIDNAGVDLVHGHSSHHFKPLEIYQNKLVLYGCGDFINDYETIESDKSFFSDVNFAYYPMYNLDTRKLEKMDMVAYTIKNMELTLVGLDYLEEVVRKLNQICAQFGISFGHEENVVRLDMNRMKWMAGGNDFWYSKYLKYKIKYMDMVRNGTVNTKNMNIKN